MTDRPVLPRRIEPLQHEQQRSPRLGPEPVVQRAEPCDQLVQPLEPGLLVRKPEPIARIPPGQSGGRSRRHLQRTDELLRVHGRTAYSAALLGFQLARGRKQPVRSAR